MAYQVSLAIDPMAPGATMHSLHSLIEAKMKKELLRKYDSLSVNGVSLISFGRLSDNNRHDDLSFGDSIDTVVERVIRVRIGGNIVKAVDQQGISLKAVNHSSVGEINYSQLRFSVDVAEDLAIQELCDCDTDVEGLHR